MCVEPPAATFPPLGFIHRPFLAQHLVFSTSVMGVDRAAYPDTAAEVMHLYFKVLLHEKETRE